MAGLGGLLTTIGTGLGGFMQGYESSRAKALQAQMQSQEIEDNKRKRMAQQQAGQGLSAALSAPGFETLAASAPQSSGGMGGLGAGGPPTGLPGAPEQSAPQYAPPPGGSGSDQLRSLLERSQSALPEGYRASVTSAERPGARVAGTGGVSQHAHGNAIDTQISGPGGPIPNTGNDTTGLYKRLALAMRSNAGDLAPKLAWGGNFTTGKPDGPRDLMHFDLGGDRGRFGTLAELVKSAPPEMMQAGRQVGAAAQRDIPREAWGRASLKAAADAIEKANPGGDPGIKFMALAQIAQILAPGERQQMQMFMLENKQQFAQAMAEYKQNAQFEMQKLRGDLSEARSGQQGWQILPTGDGKFVRAKPGTGEVQPMDLPAGTTKMPSASQSKSPLDPAQAKFWGQVVANGGTLPPGLRRSGVVEQVMKEVPGADPNMSPGDFIARHATVTADSRSLANMQKMADAAISFENLAGKNFDVALKLAPDAIPTDLGPFFNRWIEQGETMFGDPNVPPYVAAMLTGAAEYAKVMSGATGAAGSSVDSRREARDMFSPYMSLPQISNVIAVAKADMKNRENTLNEQVGEIKGRLGSTAPRSVAPPATPQMKGPQGAPGGAIKLDADGNQIP